MRMFPTVSFHSVTIHHSYLEAHLTLLEGNDKAVFVHGNGYQKAVVTAVADEQPLSQTTFKYSDCSGQFLVGLEKPFSAGTYMSIGYVCIGYVCMFTPTELLCMCGNVGRAGVNVMFRWGGPGVASSLILLIV